MQNLINNEVKKITKWFLEHRLELNLDKTYIMNFNIQSYEEIKIKMHDSDCNNTDYCNCSPIKQTRTIKYLGIHLDDNTKWKSHSNYLIKKLRFYLYIFYHLQNKVSFKFLKEIYYAWIHSTINYALLSWGAGYMCEIKKIDKIVKKIVKIININKNVSNENILEFFEIRKLYIIKTMKYIYENPGYFKKRSNIMNTRQKNQFQVPIIHKENTKKIFSYAAPKIYNEIPDDIKDIKLWNKQKKLLRSYLFNIDNIKDYFDFLK